MKVTNIVALQQQWVTEHINGSKGRRQGHTPTLGPNSFIFMQFFGKIWPNNSLAPPPWKLAPHVWEILDPSLEHEGNSYFRKTSCFAHHLVSPFENGTCNGQADLFTSSLWNEDLPKKLCLLPLSQDKFPRRGSFFADVSQLFFQQ